MRGAPFIQDFLETTLRQWAPSREAVVRRWIAEGRLQPIEPKFLFYMIWAATQHYAHAAHEIATLEKTGRALDEAAFERAKKQGGPDHPRRRLPTGRPAGEKAYKMMTNQAARGSYEFTVL